VGTLIDQHPTATVIILLTVMFAYGYLEFLAKARGRACLTWFWGLLILAGWTASFATIFSFVLALGVFATGLVALIGYYQSWESSP
jgi:hypothetical protein